MSETESDILIVGGGPAGSTIGALLAADGFKVALLEKERHPRFHIGESLLPMNMALFEKLGVLDQIAAIGIPKFGIEFNAPWHEAPVEFHFANAMDKARPSAFQVRRSVFDHILLKNAAAKGVTVVEGCRATEVEFPDEGGALVTARDEDGTQRHWRAKFLIDASGRDTLLASRFAIKRSNMQHGTAAVFGHFHGARRLSGTAEGHISIFWFEHGWIWFIPLADGTTSIGAVCRPDYVKTRKTDVTQFLMDTFALSPKLMDRLKDATIIEPATATGNYSYMADRMTGKDHIMVGDAFAFVDPVFSTGVYLAMNGAFRGAEVVRTAFRDPARTARAMARYEAETRRAIATFSWYIYNMTRPAFQDLFMAPSNVFRIEEAMMSLLAGDVFRDTPIHMPLSLFKSLFYLKTLRYKLKGEEAARLARFAPDPAA
jgi:flavin-dependent dehydrogenase